MLQYMQGDFSVVKTFGDRTKFIKHEITIVADEFSYHDGKHYITAPHTAIAHFACGRKRYVFENTDGVPTVEDWYQEEVLPKIQMLRLLLSEIET